MLALARYAWAWAWAYMWREWGGVVYRGGAWRDTCACYIRRYICDMAGGRFFCGVLYGGFYRGKWRIF